MDEQSAEALAADAEMLVHKIAALVGTSPAQLRMLGVGAEVERALASSWEMGHRAAHEATTLVDLAPVAPDWEGQDERETPVQWPRRR